MAVILDIETATQVRILTVRLCDIDPNSLLRLIGISLALGRRWALG